MFLLGGLGVGVRKKRLYDDSRVIGSESGIEPLSLNTWSPPFFDTIDGIDSARRRFSRLLQLNGKQGFDYE